MYDTKDTVELQTEELLNDTEDTGEAIHGERLYNNCMAPRTPVKLQRERECTIKEAIV